MEDAGPEDDGIDLRARWERAMFRLAHRNRMLKQAQKYAAVLPALEWMLCGDWSMQIKDICVPGRKVAFPLERRRTTYKELLGTVFPMDKSSVLEFGW